MYACLHAPEAATAGALRETLLTLVRNFSPEVEQTSADTVVFSIAPLRSMLGSWQQIASEIARQGHARNLEAHLGIAANPDTAILLARRCNGVILAMPGEEASKLADLALDILLMHDLQIDNGILLTLQQWGLRSCGHLAALPESALAERLGMAGVYLRQLALGRRNRPLRLIVPETNYEQRMDLEHPLERLEPLLFLFGRALGELCERMRSQTQAARLLEVCLALDEKSEYRCRLEFPVPIDDSHNLLKLLQLHLERHSPKAAVVGFTVRLETTEPRRVQRGLFLPPAPQPDKLQVTLARIAGLVGQENVGAPELLDTYRPDAFRLMELDLRPFQPEPDDSRRRFLRLSLRLFRPALPARVRVSNRAPRQVFADGVTGKVLERSGPWESSGEWWASSRWHHQEWDVALDDGALYRITRELPADIWIVVGMYD